MNKTFDYQSVCTLAINTRQTGLRQRVQCWLQEWKHFMALIRLWQRKARARRELLGLSDHVLKDIGISRYDAEVEGRKPFWR